MSERVKIKYWWSEDRKWFCLLADDGNAKATVSLTPEEAGVLSATAEPQVTNLDLCWEQINALGGVQTGAIEEAQCEIINQCLAIIASFGGEDPLPKRARPMPSPQQTK